jgi:glycosyltransferase involved in cell wall biosynthesis
VRTLKVAHVLPWPAPGGGTEQATLRLAQAVAPQGIQSVAWCLAEAAALRDSFRAAGFETTSYRPVFPSFRRPVPMLRNAWLLARELRRHHIDLVHCADVLAVLYAGIAARLARVPLISHVRCRFDVFSRRDRILLSGVNQWIFVSHATRNEFGYRVPSDRAAVVYDGIRFPEVPPDSGESARRELGFRSDTPVIGMVARVAPAKDYETLIRAAARLLPAYPETQFLIVGDHQSAQEYRAHFDHVQRLIAAHGLAGRFTFTGDRRDVPRLINAMDICVLTTHGEGLPLSVLEYMAQARPVLATAVGGIPEVVRHGETGLLHEHGDDAALATQLAELLTDPTRAARLGAAGQRFVRATFTWERFGCEIAAIYRAVMSGHSSGIHDNGVQAR